MTINRKPVEVQQAEPDTPLRWVPRGELQMIGTKFGCAMALCGGCTVHVDGQPTRACVTPISAVGDREATTIEGLTGQLMAAAALLKQNPRPTDADIDAALSGNICRCAYSTVTLLARLRGLSTSVPRAQAVW